MSQNNVVTISVSTNHTDSRVAQSQEWLAAVEKQERLNAIQDADERREEALKIDQYLEELNAIRAEVEYNDYEGFGSYEEKLAALREENRKEWEAGQKQLVQTPVQQDRFTITTEEGRSNITTTLEKLQAQPEVVLTNQDRPELKASLDDNHGVKEEKPIKYDAAQKRCMEVLRWMQTEAHSSSLSFTANAIRSQSKVQYTVEAYIPMLLAAGWIRMWKSKYDKGAEYYHTTEIGMRATLHDAALLQMMAKDMEKHFAEKGIKKWQEVMEKHTLPSIKDVVNQIGAEGFLRVLSNPETTKVELADAKDLVIVQ